MTRLENGGAAVVAALRACGVSTVFGIPGTHNLEMYRALDGSGITHVSPRHEQGAGFAADGYARTTGVPGVCITTSGPGLTNITTAIGTAYADSVPLLVIAPGVPRGLERRDVGWLHEMRDQQAHLQGLVDVSVRVQSADEATAVIAGAFSRWSSSRPRPVYLEVPLDVLEGPWGGELAMTPAAIGPVPGRPVPDRAQLASAARRLGDARAPVVVVGGGAVRAASELTRLVERIGAVTVSTVNGKGVVDERHPLSLGASIRLGPAQHMIDSGDVVLCLGTELGDSDLWGATLSPSGTVIRADIEAGQLQKNLPADITLHGDAREVVSELLALLGERSGESGSTQAAGSRAAAARREIEAEALLDGAPWREIQGELRRALPEDVIVAGDSAQVSYYGTVHFWPAAAPRRFLYPTGFAPLGYGLPAAIGAKAGQPGLPVIVLVGDGGFQLTSAELMTATELGLNLPVIVMNNDGYGEIRREMVERGIRPLGVGIGSPDYAAFARSFGAIGHREADPRRVGQLAAAALRADRPTVIEVPVPAG